MFYRRRMANPVTSLTNRVVRTAMQRPRTARDLVDLTRDAEVELKGKLILVTGSSSGIGAKAADRDLRCAVADIDPSDQSVPPADSAVVNGALPRHPHHEPRVSRSPPP